ncbi:hypothetical protein D3C86_1647940 [compost metagenome]
MQFFFQLGDHGFFAADACLREYDLVIDHFIIDSPGRQQLVQNPGKLLVLHIDRHVFLHGNPAAVHKAGIGTGLDLVQGLFERNIAECERHVFAQHRLGRSFLRITAGCERDGKNPLKQSNAHNFSPVDRLVTYCFLHNFDCLMVRHCWIKHPFETVVRRKRMALGPGSGGTLPAFFTVVRTGS